MRTLVLLAAALLPAVAFAEKLDIPVDVGVGPAFYNITGPVARDQTWHTGIKLSLNAIVDKELIQKHQSRVPAKYRKYLRGVDEVRISPSLFIPDALFISPKVDHTSLYGITWRPLSLTFPLLKGPLSLRLGAGLDLTYAYLGSDTLPDTHFLRPGLDLGLSAELAFSRSFILGFGWSSTFYVPERLGELRAINPFDETMWHFGQAFVQLHFRFPYEVRI